jgi:DNA-binding CsgD family transcriptional regulator
MVSVNVVDGAEARLVADIDLAARGRLDWMACIESLHDAFAADTTIMYAPPHGGRSFVPLLLHKVDLSRIASKMHSHSTDTPFLDKAIERGLAPGAFFDRDVELADLVNSEHHRDILEAIDWTDGLQFVLRLPSAPEGGLVVKLWRFHPAPRFGEDDRHRARLVFSRLLRATKGKFISPPQPTNAIVPEAFDGLSTPFIVFCAAGKALYLNAAAQSLLAKGDVIASRNGKIEPIEKKASRSFQQAIEQAISDQRQAIEIVIARADERSPVLGIINFIPKDSRSGFAADAAVIAYFVDVETHEGHSVQARRAQILFTLTEAECEVLRLLLDDCSIDEIAAHRKSAVATVRTQLKAILQKTRSHRQQDLLRFRRLAI